MKTLLILFWNLLFFQCLLAQTPEIAQKFQRLSLPYQSINAYEDTLRDGLIVEGEQWWEGVHHFQRLVGQETQIGAYINGVRQGKWLIFHDSLLFAEINYKDGFADGNATYHIHNRFYKLEEAAMISSEWKVIFICPMKDSLILKVTYQSGKLSGKYILCLANGEKILELFINSDSTPSVLYQADRFKKQLEARGSIPYEEIWNETSIVSHKERQDFYKMIYDKTRRKH